MSGADQEALRQQWLLRALLGDGSPAAGAGWLRDGTRSQRGLAVYRANAAALAERALAAAYPTLQQLLGADSFAAMARAYWQRHPPLAGDVALWGGDLAAFVAGAESLADEPCLPDVARLEWAVHEAERAADATALQGLERLADTDPEALTLRLTPGTALIVSDHPVGTIWQAHRAADADRFAPVRAAYAAGGAERVRVARQGWQATVCTVSPAEARFTAALLAGASLAVALDAAGATFAFESWLIAALQQQRLVSVEAPSPQASR